jgi:PAB-dependent poly(A)-specific ribonuclease subunit 2
VPAEGDDAAHWVMFNDFLVRHVSEEDVFGFADSWKIPAIIVLERVDSVQVLNFDAIPTKLDNEVLFKDVSVAR